MKHSLSTKLIPIAIVATLLLCGVYVYGILYLQEGHARIETLRKDIIAAEKQVADNDAVRQALDEFRLYQEEVDNHFVDADGIVTFVEEVERSARAFGLTVKIDNLNEVEVAPKPLTTVKRLNATFTVRGSWEKVARFATAVDSFPYHVYVYNASFSTDNSATGEGKDVLWVGSWNVSIPKLK